MKTFVIFLVALIGLHANLNAQRHFVTVTGNVRASELTFALPHEHVVTNFIGADSISVPSDTDSR